jgi:parallel beta-helix repeat protein
MYFGAVDPTTKTVQISTIDNLITFTSGNDYITIDHISLKGANQNAVYSHGNDFITIQNCDINFSGCSGVQCNNSSDNYIGYTTINHSNEDAVISYGSSDNLTIYGCIISNTGLFPGLGRSFVGTQSFSGIIAWQGDGITIQETRIYNSGYNGIAVAGDGATILNCYIDTFCSLKDDGGGIYYGFQDVYSNLTITSNVIINGIGDVSGTSDAGLYANGIYLDDNTTGGVTIYGNTIAQCVWNGIMLHNSNNVTIKQNTIYDCGNTVNYNYGALNFQQDLVGSTSIRNMVVDHNQFIAKTATQSTFWARSAATSSDLSLWGIFDYNYYARPIADNTTIKAGYNTWDPTAITIAAWKTASSQDANSNKSLGGTVSTVNDLHFIYNDLT